MIHKAFPYGYNRNSYIVQEAKAKGLWARWLKCNEVIRNDCMGKTQTLFDPLVLLSTEWD